MGFRVARGIIDTDGNAPGLIIKLPEKPNEQPIAQNIKIEPYEEIAISEEKNGSNNLKIEEITVEKPKKTSKKKKTTTKKQ